MDSNNVKLKYRPEIDGLRAIAVLPVIFYHAGFEVFKGGYVGVDVFFVISGFLITTIIIQDLENNQFRFIKFYERRARRILPAFIFMILVSLIIGYFVLTPYYYKDLFQTALSSSIFLSNFLLYLKSGYFSAISELKPLLHTWSLSVEEQFYILFPLLLFFPKKKLLYLILLFILSVVFAEIIINYDKNANFYLLPSRAFELLAGSIASFFVYNKKFKLKNSIAIIGLFIIIFSIFFFDEKTPLPGLYSLIPVTGTVLLLLYSTKETIVAKIISFKIFVWIGLISYSLYLWHQPFFSFLRHLSMNEPTNISYFYTIALIFVISYFSYRYIEKPFRNKNKFNGKSIILLSTSFLFLIFFIGYVGHKNSGFPKRLSLEDQIIANGAFDKNPNQSKCYYYHKIKNIKNACLLGELSDTKPTIALIGDSHADHFAFSLHKALKSLGMTAYDFSFHGCNPKIDPNSMYKENDCYEEIKKFLLKSNNIKTLIISYRWTKKITGLNYGEELKNSEKFYDERSYYFSKKIESLVGTDKNLILIYPSPEAGYDVPNYTVKRRFLKEKDFEIKIPYEDFIKRNLVSYKGLDAINVRNSVYRVYPENRLCEKRLDGYCFTIINKKSLYFDDNHLSNYGASIIVKDILNILRKINNN